MTENHFNILALGDIVGPGAVEYVAKRLWNIRKEYDIDLVVANGENASVGNGLEPAVADELLACGVDVITSGNHIWQKKPIFDYLDVHPNVLRPANYPGRDPGNGYVILDAGGLSVLVINVLGTVFMEALGSPFDTVEGILEKESGKYDISVLDIHAEASSEKGALAHCFDGKINFIFGTHTHVTTADERILKGGTAFITDLGMCGPEDSVLGVKKEIIIEKMRTKMPARFELAHGDIEANGVKVSINKNSLRAEKIERIKF